MANPRTKPKFCNKNVATGSAWRVSLCIRSGSCDQEKKKHKNYQLMSSPKMSCEKGLQKLLSAITHLRKPRENGYKLWAQWFLISLGQTGVSYDCSMVFKAAFNQSYAMLCHPKDLRNHCAKACTHSPYNLLGLGIRGYGKEVSMAKWWARTTPANHYQVAPSKRRDFNGKLPTGPRTAAGYVTKSCFTWLVW